MNRRRFSLASTSLLAAFALAACSKTESTPAAAAAASTADTPAPAAASDKLTAKDAYDLAAKSNGFTVGAMMAANTVYVFFDPTCPHCAELWGASKPLLNRLKMVWIPVGLLRPTSAALGGTILAAPNPEAAMQENESGVLSRGAGVTPNPSLPEDIVAKVKANTDAFTKLGADSVPLIVYKNAKSGEFGQRAGSMDTAGLAALAGI